MFTRKKFALLQFVMSVTLTSSKYWLRQTLCRLQASLNYISLRRREIKAIKRYKQQSQKSSREECLFFFNLIVKPPCQSHKYQANMSTHEVPLLLYSEQSTQSCPYHICNCWSFSKLNGLERLPRISSRDL